MLINYTIGKRKYNITVAISEVADVIAELLRVKAEVTCVCDL